MTNSYDDTISGHEVVSRLASRRRWIAGGLLLGGLLGLGIAVAMPSRYKATAKVLVRDASSSAGVLSALSGLDRLIPGGSPTTGGLATEIEIMTSRPVMESVIDSLCLQGKITEPRGVSVQQVFSTADFLAKLPKPAVYYFSTREGGTYQVRGGNISATVAVGARISLPAGTVVLRSGSRLPKEFKLRVVGIEDALKEMRRALKIEKATGDVAKIEYTAEDSRTAAAVPNALVSRYLARRTTSERGVNRRRYEFLLSQTDSVQAELAGAEAALRAYQEGSGVVDAELYGKTEFQRAAELRAESETLEVEIRALRKLTETRGASLSASEIAAYPTFLRNPAINDLLGRILEAQTRRRTLLERRTDRDPEVVALTGNITDLQAQLVSLSRSYLSGLEKQYGEVAQALAGYRTSLQSLPSQVQSTTRLQREVRRLTETLLALQTQLVQSRLETIGEGGDVREIEPASAPEDPSAPRPLLYVVIGLIVGLFAGLVIAAIRAFSDRRVRDVRDAEAASGLAVVAAHPSEPILLGRVHEHASVLILAAGAGVDPVPVARMIAATAEIQGRGAVCLDLTDSCESPDGSRPGRAEEVGPATRSLARVSGSSRLLPPERDSLMETGDALRKGLRELEAQQQLAVVALPPLPALSSTALLSRERPVVIVAAAGRTTKAELAGVVAALHRLGLDASGVVLEGSVNGSARRN